MHMLACVCVCAHTHRVNGDFHCNYYGKKKPNPQIRKPVLFSVNNVWVKRIWQLTEGFLESGSVMHTCLWLYSLR